MALLLPALVGQSPFARPVPPELPLLAAHQGPRSTTTLFRRHHGLVEPPPRLPLNLPPRTPRPPLPTPDPVPPGVDSVEAAVAIGFTGHDGCLLWTGQLNRKGYGLVRWRGGLRNAHAVVLELTVGPTPVPGWHAAHSPDCTSRRCVNPRHLRWASPVENAADRRVAVERRLVLAGQRWLPLVACEDT